MTSQLFVQVPRPFPQPDDKKLYRRPITPACFSCVRAGLEYASVAMTLLSARPRSLLHFCRFGADIFSPPPAIMRPRSERWFGIEIHEAVREFRVARP